MPIFKAMRVSNFYFNVLKPIADWVVGLALTLILIPIMIILTVIMYFHFGRNPFFVQQRPGKNGRPFSLLKFKTMRVEGDENSTTKLGKFLRSFSLDELPQLFNVLRGDMSLVGPRPLLMEYLSFYNEEEKHRHDVRPGITGWAQVNGRNQIDWGKRMQLDIYYVQNVSFLLDCRILWKTIIEVLKRDRTSYKNDVTIKFSEYASKR